jgi:hypothetical protein
MRKYVQREKPVDQVDVVGSWPIAGRLATCLSPDAPDHDPALPSGSHKSGQRQSQVGDTVERVQRKDDVMWLDLSVFPTSQDHVTYLVVPRHATIGNTAPLSIGRKGPVTGDYWIGKLDDVRVWNVARVRHSRLTEVTLELAGDPGPILSKWIRSGPIGARLSNWLGNLPRRSYRRSVRTLIPARAAACS